MTLYHSDIERLLASNDERLFREADLLRRELCGDEVHIRGIIEFSNVCSRNCLYCGLRRGNTSLPRYTMSIDEIRTVASRAANAGVRTIVLQSGENDREHAERLSRIIEVIKRDLDVAVTLCVGVRPRDCYEAWRDAGADRYLLKHETAIPCLYKKFHPDSRLEDRLSGLARLRALGYQVGNGCIIGLPGQTLSDLAADIVLTQELDVDMAAFGPFVPHPNTPLATATTTGLELSLRVVAAARLALGPVHIPATTAFDAIAADGRERALRCGANVIMANLTPDRYRYLYDIYPGGRSENSLQRVKEIIARAGRPLATDHGHSLKRSTRSRKCTELQKV